MTEKLWLDFALGLNRFSRTVLATLCFLVVLPAAAQLSLDDDFVVVEFGVQRSQMSPFAVAVKETIASTKQGILTAEGVGVYDGSSGTLLLATGLQFPDVSLQGSAAYSKSETDALLAAAAPVAAWPMICKTDVLDGSVPIPPLNPTTLFCRSPQPGVPGGVIGSGAGVPNGYFFVVTDILARCGFQCDGVFFGLARRDNIQRTDIERWKFPLSSTTPAGHTSAAIGFSGPLMILEPGDYLVGWASLSTSGGHAVYAQVMGYLTANPERFGR